MLHATAAKAQSACRRECSACLGCGVSEWRAGPQAGEAVGGSQKTEEASIPLAAGCENACGSLLSAGIARARCQRS
jgi:hypothetical protein